MVVILLKHRDKIAGHSRLYIERPFFRVLGPAWLHWQVIFSRLHNFHLGLGFHWFSYIHMSKGAQSFVFLIDAFGYLRLMEVEP